MVGFPVGVEDSGRVRMGGEEGGRLRGRQRKVWCCARSFGGSYFTSSYPPTTTFSKASWARDLVISFVVVFAPSFKGKGVVPGRYRVGLVTRFGEKGKREASIYARDERGRGVWV